MRWAPEDALPTIARPPPRSEMVQVFLQRTALQDGPPGRRPVSLTDSVLLPQEKPPDANLQGVCVGRHVHAYASEGAGFVLCACALCHLLCSSDGRYGRAEQEGRNPASPPPSATRSRCRARGPLRRSCMWCACSLPYSHGKGRGDRVYRNWLGEPIPVLGPKARAADNPT